MRDLNELVIFTAIVDQMSFTRAADVLEISKAAASKAIANMETRLGTRLFERTTRSLRITEAGEVFLTYARRALEQANEAEVAVTKLNQKPRGTLRIVMPVTLAQRSVAPRLAPFLRKYPDLRLDIVLKGGQIDPISQHVDLVFQTAKPVTDSRVIQRRLLEVKMGIYASPGYLKNAPLLHAPEDLAEHSCLTLTAKREGAIWKLHHGRETKEIRLRSRISVGDPVIQLQLCADAAGLAILPNWLANEEIRKRQIVRVLPEWLPSPMELYVLYPTRLSVTPKLRAFLDFVERALPKH